MTIENPCVCGSISSAPTVVVSGEQILRCLDCGLVRQARRPSSASLLYDDGYYTSDNAKGGYANYFLDAGINRRTFGRRLRAIERRYGRRGRLLDVGAALGDFVLEATAHGWQAEGAEISGFAVAEGRKRGAVMHQGTLESLGLAPASYDVITLYDAIEHLFDPIATLVEIRRLLVPGGLVHIVTPNVDGLQARVLGRYWYHYKPGEHLYYFSPKTLRASVEDAGLRWNGWTRAGSYVTVSYVLNRLRVYAPQPFGALDRIGRMLRFGPFAFNLYVGEMEAWARRDPS